MKDSGMFRRIDELGRIVIPRELRKSLRIDVGTKMEIFINDEGDMVLKKTSELKDKAEYDKVLASLCSIIDSDILIVDRDKVLSSNQKKFVGQELTQDAHDIVRKHDCVVKKRTDGAIMIDILKGEKNDYCCELFVPVIRDGDSIGAIIVVADNVNNFSNEYIKICKAFATMLSLVD